MVLRSLRILAVAALVCGTVSAQVNLTLDNPGQRVVSRSTRILTAPAKDGLPRTWACELSAEDRGLGAALELITARPGQISFAAPILFISRTFVVRVTGTGGEGPAVTGELAIEVHPDTNSGGLRFLMDQTFPGVFDAPPAMQAFYGEARLQAADVPDDCIYKSTRGLAFISDPAMGPLDRHWLMLNGTGFQAISLGGLPTPAPWLPRNASGEPPIRTFAVRPPGGMTSGPALVYSTSGTTPSEPGGTVDDTRLFSLTPGHEPVLLFGSEGKPAAAAECRKPPVPMTA